MEQPATERQRKYKHVWDRIISDPSKTVAVKVTKKEMLARVRKAVWKEKDLCTRVNSSGTLLKKLYRLSVEILESDLRITFKLTPTNHPDNF